MPEPLLEVRGLEAWYGESHILHGVDFEIRPGEMVTLLGRNGAGKTTTLKSIMGIVSRRRGSVRLEGRELIELPSNRIARLGLAFCPEERGIFASLTVEENLLLPPVVKPGGLGVDAIYELFSQSPRAAARRRHHALGRRAADAGDRPHLENRARLLLLDEPTEGLAPVIVQQIGATLGRLKREGFTVLLVEQNFPLRRHGRRPPLRDGERPVWT